MTMRHPSRPGVRRALLAVATALALAGAACGDDDGPDPVAYFETLESSQIALDEAMSALFETPTAQQVDALGVGDSTAPLTGDEEAVVRRFVTEFWTGAIPALAEHHDDLEDLAAPEDVEPAHGAYLTAMATVIDGRDTYLAQVDAAEGRELLDGFWDPGPEVQALDDACAALQDHAEAAGIDVRLPMCADG